MTTITQDPLENCSLETTLSFPIVGPINSSSSVVPSYVNNWGFSDGAILGLLIKSGTSEKIIGTSVMVAPGLAITAKHNIDEYSESIKEGKVIPYCVGIRGADCDMWQCTSISYNNDDIAFLSIKSVSKLPEDKCYPRLGVTTRKPSVGEELHLIGFRYNGENKKHVGNMYASLGRVTNVFPEGRDSCFLPYPVIEIACGSLGGMSGGAAIDKNGLLMGIISTSLDTVQGSGPSYISWIISALDREVTISWPRGLYSNPVNPLSMNRNILFIDRPEAISIKNDKLTYLEW